MVYSDQCAVRSVWSQLFMLLFLVLLGALLSSFLGVLILSVPQGGEVSALADSMQMRMIQFVSAVCTFLLPALGVASMSGPSLRSYLALRSVPCKCSWLFVIGGVGLLLPVVNLLSWINRQLVLPEFLSSLDQWMRVQEDLAQRLTETMLSEAGAEAFAANLFVVALTAAITEEFLFRGCLQQIIQRSVANRHVAVWLTAFLFSSFHLQFFGFLPRLVLGAYLGYLLCWSRSVWVPVFAHFVNNAVAVCVMSSSSLKGCDYVTGEFSPDHLHYYVVAALVSLCLFAVLQKELHHRFMMQR